eukprot:COSAG01_NODE_18551_length_1069_cov_0.619588_1_plen_61_part_10
MQWPPFLLDIFSWVDFAINLDLSIIVAPECNFPELEPKESFLVKHVSTALVFPFLCVSITL